MPSTSTAAALQCRLREVRAGGAAKVACPTCASGDITRKLSVSVCAATAARWRPCRGRRWRRMLWRRRVRLPLITPRSDCDRRTSSKGPPGPFAFLMDLRRLEIFVRVAEFGSFSRAAEALFLTQPTVSEHVRALEDELGVQLLDRLGRGAAPTPAGQLLLGYARKLLTLAGEAQQAVDQFQGRVSGELVGGRLQHSRRVRAAALIGAFRTKHPEIAVLAPDR